MNEILQKRIKEAARIEREQCREDNNEIWRGNPTYNDVEASFIKGATFALQNQWIPVEEALPKDFEKVFFRAVGKNDSVCYGTGYVAKEDWYTDIQCVEQDYFKFKITHWAPIPSLEGGEK